MRRSEIIEGVQQIIKAIDESNIIKCFENILRRSERNSNALPAAMESIKTYFIKAQNFNSFARQIISNFKLDDLESSGLWIAIADEDLAPSAIHPFYQSLSFIRNQIPSIINLLKREYSDTATGNTEPIISNGKEMKVLSVTIFESNNRFSSPQRLVNVLDSVNTFYTACAYIHGESPDTLSVVGCDSGSDKSFDFLGVAKVIECVTQLIENLWDRVVFYREKQLEARLDLIDKSLPIYEKLSELETNKKIEPELAERLRRNISEGVNKFVESGASIPEIDARSTYSSRSLLSPVQKLLVSAPEEMEEVEIQQTTKTHSTVFNDLPSEKLKANNLTSDEQSQLFELLEKMKKSKNTNGNEAESENFEFNELDNE